jgi:hypothetical protein
LDFLAEPQLRQSVDDASAEYKTPNKQASLSEKNRRDVPNLEGTSATLCPTQKAMATSPLSEISLSGTTSPVRHHAPEEEQETGVPASPRGTLVGSTEASPCSDDGYGDDAATATTSPSTDNEKAACTSTLNSSVASECKDDDIECETVLVASRKKPGCIVRRHHHPPVVPGTYSSRASSGNSVRR